MDSRIGYVLYNIDACKHAHGDRHDKRVVHLMDTFMFRLLSDVLL